MESRIKSRINGSGPQDVIKNALSESARLKLLLIDTQMELIEAIADAICKAIRQGGKVVFMGNGGSAADAQHLAAELVGRFQMEREAIPAISLTTDTSILSSLGNDYGFDVVFRRQVEALVGERDVVVAISTSGSSANILEAVRAAREKGAVCVGFTGQDGNALSQHCDYCLHVPSNVTARIQEVHITVGHIICELVETGLFGV